MEGGRETNGRGYRWDYCDRREGRAFFEPTPSYRQFELWRRVVCRLSSDGIAWREARNEDEDRPNVCATRIQGWGSQLDFKAEERPIRWEVAGCTVTYLSPGLTSTIGPVSKPTLRKFAKCVQLSNKWPRNSDVHGKASWRLCREESWLGGWLSNETLVTGEVGEVIGTRFSVVTGFQNWMLAIRGRRIGSLYGSAYVPYKLLGSLDSSRLYREWLWSVGYTSNIPRSWAFPPRFETKLKSQLKIQTRRSQISSMTEKYSFSDFYAIVLLA